MMKIALAFLLFVAVIAAAPLLHADNTNTIQGSYIVILKDGMSVHDRDAHIQDLQDSISAAADAESEIGFRYNIGSLIGFSARLSPSMLKQELSHADVAYVEVDQVMTIIDEKRSDAAVITQTGATWGLDRIDQANLPLNGNYIYNSVAGSGVDVYVIDTGILTTHTDFGGRATSVFNAISNEGPSDLNGHGTHCAGTIGGTRYGVAKEVALKAVKVLSGSGSGTTSGVIGGVNYVTNNKSPTRKSVASMSLGGGASTTLDSAVANAVSAGVPFAVAAGNDGSNACNYSPARAASAITVGATTSTDARASYSNYGTCVDIFAPGSSITSDWIGSNTATNTISGTSMATPHVAGAIALHLSLHPTDTPSGVATWLRNNATPNKVTNPGSGSPNYLLYSPLS